MPRDGDGNLVIAEDRIPIRLAGEDYKDGTKAEVLTFLNVADGAEVNPDVVSQAEAEAGTSTDERIFTPERVKQAIDALASGSGDVSGPASSTDNTLPRFNGTTGKTIQGSGVVVDDSNNITGVGTVDGRDLAADGSKLDLIEANADVTDTANVTAAGALMDSEVDADIKTLSLPANTTISTFGASLIDDANAGAARTTLGAGTMDDVVDDTTPQLGGNLDVNGNQIVSVSNGDIEIIPNGTGNVGINKTSPLYQLDVDASVTSSTWSNGMRINVEQGSGGGAAAVINGIEISGDVTGGTFNHFNGVLAYLQDLTDTQNVPFYQGVEGRVDMNITGSAASSNTPFGVGVHGFVNMAGADNTNTTLTALKGQAEVLPAATGDKGTLIGLHAWAKDGASNINAIFGEGTDSGDNAYTEHRGYITDGAGMASAQMSVDDTNDEFLIDLTDAKLDGLGVQLRDAAGVAKFHIRDSAGTSVFAVDSDGAYPRVAPGVITRATNGSTGTVAETGLGGKPTGIWFFMNNNTSFVEQSWGFSDGTTDICNWMTSAVGVHSGTTCIHFDNDGAGTETQVATVSSLDSDGFTLSWTNVGTLNESLKIVYMAVLEMA